MLCICLMSILGECKLFFSETKKGQFSIYSPLLTVQNCILDLVKKRNKDTTYLERTAKIDKKSKNTNNKLICI